MVSDAMLALIVADQSSFGYAVEIETDDNVYVRAHTGVGELIIDGQTYYGVGEFGSVDPIEQIGDTSPTRLNVGLVGIPAAILPEALKAKMRGRPAKLILLAFDPVTERLQRAEAALIGFVTNYNIAVDETGEVSVEIADEFELYEMPWHKYWTEASHGSDNAGDHICRYVAQMEEREIQWGSAGDAPPLRYE